MTHQSLRKLQRPTSRSGPAYTWQRRGPGGMGILFLGLLVVFALYIGPARPMSLEAVATWTWAGQRSHSGAVLRSLEALHDNQIENDTFQPGVSPADVPGWEQSSADPNSTIRSVHIENTPLDWQLLELVPQDGDEILVRQWVDVDDTPPQTLAFTTHALSTMGDARVYAEFVDTRGRHVGTIGWTLVGTVPPSVGIEQWHDHRTRANYLGSELTVVLDLNDTLPASFGLDLSRLGKVGLFFQATNGQHLLVESVYLGTYPAESLGDQLKTLSVASEQQADSPFVYRVPSPGDTVKTVPVIRGMTLAVSPQKAKAKVGETFQATARLTNTTSEPLGPFVATFTHPYGYGLVNVGPKSVQIGRLMPGEEHVLTWPVKALRSHEVNLGQPWRFGVMLSAETGEVLRASGLAEVVDDRPGQIFYVLTDDLEPMDSAGYPTRFTGNRNGWLDPEELRVQLIEKSEAMNRIADRYGAKWSHYIAWPFVLGAEWAASNSPTGAWDQAIADLTQSVATEAARGHQYAPHLHVDYDPRLPDTFLSYDPVTDGFWANHRAHGWAHQIARLGEFDELNSRTGTLFDSMRRIDEIVRSSGQGQQLATRTGSFDFGIVAHDQRKSIEAFRRVGLWASSDAHGNLGRATAAPYGENMYFTRPDSVNERAESLEDIGIVQFLPTPSRAIVFEGETITSANEKVDQAMAHYSSGDAVRPGVHSIVAFTHAMFLLGEGDWRSTTGGAFDVIDQHLSYVKDRYVDRGLIEFGTSNELIHAWLDYYTPTLLAFRGPEIARPEAGVYEYPIVLVGRDIPLGEGYAHEVTVKYPLYMHDTAVWAGVYRDDELIARFDELPTPYNDITFTVDEPGDYRMLVIEFP